jgi:Ni/Fe-hydrogenase 1 B-type cytochrome subunit
MGWVRYVHTVTGWIFLAALVARLFRFFNGNEYARWRAFLPHRREHFTELKEALRFYLFLRRDYPHMDFGHNRLAAATYSVVYLLLFFMVVSGLALHGMAFSTGWQSWLTWPLAFVSPQTLRLMHHMGMWLIWGFVAHHVASAVLVDHETRGGLMGGIFSGWKVFPKSPK